MDYFIIVVTTAAGLCVAIPSLMAYWIFIARVDQLITNIDALGQEVVELIASDSWLRDQTDEAGRNRKRLKAA